LALGAALGVPSGSAQGAQGRAAFPKAIAPALRISELDCFPMAGRGSGVMTRASC
jgi:hypothetical protein